MSKTKQPPSTEILSDKRASEAFEKAFADAVAEHEKGRLPEAHKRYRDLLKQQPNNAAVLHAKAVVLFQQDRVDDALPFAERAVNAAPEQPEYLNSLGLILRNMRKPEAAIKHFKAALKLRPGYFEAMSNMGLVYTDMGNREEATKLYKKALEASPNHPDVLLNLAHTLRDSGQEQEALIYYRKLVELQPESPRHVFNLAIVLHALGQFDEAVKHLERVVALDPKDVNAQHLLKATRGDTNAANVPDQYVAQLFDSYANEFDHHLQTLGYQVPQMLAARIPVVVAPKTKRGLWNMLDLGCGTGACGRIFNEECRHMIGVDLSKKMIEKAREYNIYDELHTTSIEDYFKNSTALFDLIFAADVLVYMGALESLFQEVADHLKPGGLFAFSTEVCTPQEGDYVLRNSGRVAQSDAYILRLAKQFNLRKMINADITVRMGHNEPIAGKLYILKK